MLKEYLKSALPLTLDSACQKHLTQTLLDYQYCIKFIDSCTRLSRTRWTDITLTDIDAVLILDKNSMALQTF